MSSTFGAPQERHNAWRTDNPQLAERMRRIALHLETANLLRLRATRARTALAAELLQQRAIQHHEAATALRTPTAVKRADRHDRR